MKLQPNVKKEIIRIVGGNLVCTAIMWVVFALLSLVLPAYVVFDGTVVLGGVLGMLVASANFIVLCITVQFITEKGNPAAAKGWMQVSYNIRLLLQAVWCIVAIQLASVHFIVGMLPLLFPRIVIIYLQKTGAYTPESTTKPETVDPEGVFADPEGGETEQ